MCKAGCFREIVYDFATLDTGTVNFINQGRLDGDKSLVDIRAFEDIEFMQDPILTTVVSSLREPAP